MLDIATTNPKSIALTTHPQLLEVDKVLGRYKNSLQVHSVNFMCPMLQQ